MASAELHRKLSIRVSMLLCMFQLSKLLRMRRLSKLLRMRELSMLLRMRELSILLKLCQRVVDSYKIIRNVPYNFIILVDQKSIT